MAYVKAAEMMKTSDECRQSGCELSRDKRGGRLAEGGQIPADQAYEELRGITIAQRITGVWNKLSAQVPIHFGARDSSRFLPLRVKLDDDDQSPMEFDLLVRSSQ